MSTIEYDFDSSGGIMEQIHKLVAPPISDEAARRSRRRNRGEHRRHGRAINHDCCDSCKEGGDLLCCDRCPAAFHLLCHDPPLLENELPPGEWVCHRCRVTPNEGKDDDAESTSSSRSGRLKRSAPDDAMECQPSTSAAGLTAKDAGSQDKAAEPETPLHMLIKAARLMNPAQFELSKDIACTTPLPGSSKRVYGRSYRAPKKQAHELDNGLVPLPAKVCFTCTKSCRVAPLVQCDYCPLLFHMDCLNPPLTSLPTGRWMCPNHVQHFLDDHMVRSNSLTERIKLWDTYEGMIDQHSVKLDFFKHVHRQNPQFRFKRRLPPRKTISVPEAVKAHYENRPAMLPLPARSTPVTSVPAPQLTAGHEATPQEQEEWLSSVVCLQTDIAKHLSKKQLQKSGALGSSSSSEPEGSKASDPCAAAKPTASVAPVVQRDSDNAASCAGSVWDSGKKDAEGEDCSKGQGEVSNGASEQSVSKPAAISLLHGNLASTGAAAAMNGDADILDVQKAKEAAVRTRSNSADASGVVKMWQGGDKASTPTSPSPSACNVAQGKNIVISTINKAHSTVLTKVVPGGAGGARGAAPSSILSPRVLVQPSLVQRAVTTHSVQTQAAAAAAQQAKVMAVSTAAVGSKASSAVTAGKGAASGLQSMPAILHLNSALQQWIEGSPPDGVGEFELSKMDEKMLQLLAWQRLQQLLPPSSPSSPSPSPAASKKGLLNGLLSPGDHEVRARAVLCPLTGKGPAVPMPYRTLSMGTGADMEVSLYQFGHCNFLSSKHAVIFYDEMTRHFELLNYSDFGTTVDNVLYSCDFSDKPASTIQPSPVVASVRQVIGKHKKKAAIKEPPEDPAKEKRYLMAARTREARRGCSCKANSLSLMGGSGAGWEGTAILHHGSYIRLGCLQFVFSIVDQASQELLPPPAQRPPEQMSLLKTHLKALP